MRKRTILPRNISSPQIGDYDTLDISEQLKFRKPPRVIISTREFDPQQYKNLGLL